MTIDSIARLPMELQIVQTSEDPDFSGTAQARASRELGLYDATEGLFTARRVRAGPPALHNETLQGHPDPWFTFMYVLRGSVSLRLADGEGVKLSAQDAVSQTQLTEENIIGHSDDFEFLEFQALEGTQRYLPKRPGQELCLDRPEAHVLGTGPRSFFDYRNLGVANACDRMMEVQVIRAQRAKQGGTGWHSHTMAQLSYGLSGWAMLDVEGVAGQVRQAPGDALCIPAGWRHNASAFSDDYGALQIQIPADYETDVREAPPAP